MIPYRDPFYASRRPTLAIPAGNVLQIGTDSSDVELGLASAADRPQVDLRRGPPRDRAAHRLREPEPIALHRLRHLGHGEHHQHVRARAGSAAISICCRRRSIRWSRWNTVRETPRPLMARIGRRAGDHEPGDLRVLEPEHRRRSDLRAHGADAHLVAPSRRSSAPGVRELDDAGGAGHARSRGDGGDVSSGA